MDVQIVQTNTGSTVFYAGIVQVQGQELHFAVEAAQGAQGTAHAYLPVDGALDDLLPDMGTLVQQAWAAGRGSVRAIEQELKQAMSMALSSRRAAKLSPVEIPTPAFGVYRAVCSQLDELGWAKIAAVDLPASSATVSLRDARRRTHTISVSWDAGFPRSAPRVLVDAPPDTVPDVVWRPGQSSLRGVLRGVRRALDALDAFWSEMESVDAALVVLEPENPRRCDAFRRVAAGRHCALLLTIDPVRPRAQCALEFFGAEAVAARMHAACAAARLAWDPSRSVVDNLDRALGTPLPRASAAAADDEGCAVECGICYAYALPSLSDGAVVSPDVACNNPKCAKPFHASCLREWLVALPTARQSLGTVFGTCPYCGETVRVGAAGS